MTPATPIPFAVSRLKALSDLPLIGRSREFGKLRELVHTKSPALVCGPTGTGKTRLLAELRQDLVARRLNVVSLRFEQPLHAFLLQLANRISIDGANLSSIALRGVIWKALESKPRILLVDNVAEASTPFYRLLNPY